MFKSSKTCKSIPLWSVFGHTIQQSIFWIAMRFNERILKQILFMLNSTTGKYFLFMMNSSVSVISWYSNQTFTVTARQINETTMLTMRFYLITSYISLWVKLENVVNILSNRLQIINATVYQFFYLRMRERNLKIS